MSRPARGEWIEISIAAMRLSKPSKSRPARGEWIEIGGSVRNSPSLFSLAPHGASGLKLSEALFLFYRNNVSPRTGRVD